MDDRAEPAPEALDALALRARDGDRSAFTELFLATERELRTFLSAHSSSVDMVDEVLQAAYVACYGSLARYEARGMFLPWLKGIGKNLLLKELHERARLATAEEGFLEGALARAGLRSLDEPDPAPSERLKRCMAKLPPHSRELLERRYAGQVSLGRIARTLRRSESWVAVTLFRIRETLRACLTGGAP